MPSRRTHPIRALSMVAALVLAAMVSLVATAQSASAAPPSTGWWRLQHQVSPYCLVVQGTAQDAPVIQLTCAHYNDQEWAINFKGLLEDGRRSYEIRNRSTNKCLVARTSSGWAVQAGCAEYADQRWIAAEYPDTASGTRYFGFRNVASNRCLEQGSAVRQQAFTNACNFLPQQLWEQIPVA